MSDKAQETPQTRTSKVKNMTKEFEDSMKDLPLDELEAMMNKMQGLVEKRVENKKKDAIRQIQDLVRNHELPFDDVVNALRNTAKRGKATPVYRNPEKPRQTWSGKGKAPDWFKTHPDPESLRIPGA